MEESVALTPSTNRESEQNGKLIKAMIIGAIVGGVVAMLDSTTRNKMMTSTRGIKDSTVEMVTQIKENPSEVKEDWQKRIKKTSSALKEIITDAQDLYEKVNSSIVEPASEIQKDASDILSSTKEAADDLKDIGSKVKDVGEDIAVEQKQNRTLNTNGSIRPNQPNPYN